MFYIVNINYAKFKFHDAVTAMNFAELAKTNIMPDLIRDKNEVFVEFVIEEPAAVEEEE